jgi:hypothetical protein
LSWLAIRIDRRKEKIPRVAYLAPGSRSNPLAFEPCRQELGELGYVEGQTIIVDVRWAEGRQELMPEMAAELVRLGVDVLVTGGGAGV